MKSLELENQSLHKGVCRRFCRLAGRRGRMTALFLACLVVENLKAALQKLESRVAVLEKPPAPAAVPAAKVG